MSRWSAGSRRYRTQRREFLAAYPVCHLCGHPGADQIDHIIPTSMAPWLADNPANWRPAHGVHRCPFGCGACNQIRGTKTTVTISPKSRSW